MSKKSKNQDENAGSFLDELNETPTAVKVEKEKDVYGHDVVNENFKPEDETDSDPFAVSGEMQMFSLPFHNPENDGPLKGVYLGLGPKMKGIREDYNTIAVHVPGVGPKLMPFSKLFEKLHAECAPSTDRDGFVLGTHLVEIVALGKRESKTTGSEYNNYSISYGLLKTPFKSIQQSELIKERK